MDNNDRKFNKIGKCWHNCKSMNCRVDEVRMINVQWRWQGSNFFETHAAADGGMMDVISIWLETPNPLPQPRFSDQSMNEKHVD